MYLKNEEVKSMKYSTSISKIIPTAFSLMVFTILSCNTAFGADAPVCLKLQIGCWQLRTESKGVTRINPIMIEQTLENNKGKYSCKIAFTPDELKTLCQKANPNSKNVRVQVINDIPCPKMHNYIVDNGYYDDMLQVCVIPLKE